MANRRLSNALRAWDAARATYQQLQIRYDAIDASTSLDESEEIEMALEAARTKLFHTRSPHLAALLEKLHLNFGVDYLASDDPEAMALFEIADDICWLMRVTQPGDA